jgi:hypothetical protein
MIGTISGHILFAEVSAAEAAAIGAACGAAPPTGQGGGDGLDAGVSKMPVLYTLGIQNRRLINWLFGLDLCYFVNRGYTK